MLTTASMLLALREVRGQRKRSENFAFHLMVLRCVGRRHHFTWGCLAFYGRALRPVRCAPAERGSHA
jgi:hypothetical protein